MIPVAVRVAIALLGALMIGGSFLIRSSVDRGLAIRSDAPPPLGIDATAFTLRIVGAVVLMAGLLTWVVAYSIEKKTGIF